MIIDISTDFSRDPRMVRITTTDDFSTITTSGYITDQESAISSLNNGQFEWVDGDAILIFYNGGTGTFTRNSETNSFSPAGEGNVNGPGSSIDNGLVVFDGTDGLKIKNPTFNSSITGHQLAGYIDNSGEVELISLGIGLQMNDEGVISAPGSGGTVTEIDTGTGLTGGPITSSGTISMSDIVVGGTVTNPSILTYNNRGQITAATSGDAPVTSVTGTANEITVTGTTAVTLSIPTNPVLHGLLSTDELSTANVFIKDSGSIPADPVNGVNIFTQQDIGTGLSTPFYQDEDGNVFPWGTAGGGGSVTLIDTAGGLTGGPITTTGTISIADLVSGATVTNPSSMTFNNKGQVTAATSGTAPVTSVSGTTNQITVTGTDNVTVAISDDAILVGNTSSDQYSAPLVFLSDSVIVPSNPVDGNYIFSQQDIISGNSKPYYINEDGEVFPWGTGGGGGGSVTLIDTTNGITGGPITTTGTLGIIPNWLIFSTARFSTAVGTNRTGIGTGAFNFIGGYGAGFNVSTGQNNVYIGYNAGATNTVGNNNTVVGSSSFDGATTASSNSLFGSLAGTSLTTGSNNCATGESALGVSSTDNNNCAYGYHSFWLGTGSGNSFFGTNSGNTNAAFTNCSFFGFNASTNQTTLNNSAAFGANSLVTANNAYSYGNSSVNHGFGTSAPLAKMHVNGNTLLQGQLTTWDNVDTSTPTVITGKVTKQAYLQTNGLSADFIFSVSIPTSGIAVNGSVTIINCDLTIVDADIATNGGGWGKSTVALLSTASGLSFISLSPPRVTFTTAGVYAPINAAWIIFGSEVRLSVQGPTGGTNANWLATYDYTTIPTDMFP